MIKRLKHYTERARSSFFFMDIAVMQVSTVSITMLSIASSVILARILGPDQYGTYAIIFSFTALLASFSDWSGANFVVTTFLSRAYVEKDRVQIEEIISYVAKMFIFVFVPLTLIAIIIAPHISTTLYHSSYIGVMARLLLFENILGALFGIVKIILEATRKIKKLTVLEIFEKIIFIVLPISLVLLHYGITGFVWGSIVASVCMLIIGITMYRKLTQHDELFPPLRRVIAGIERPIARKFFAFGFNASLDKTLSNINAILPILFLAAAASRSEVGFYKLAMSYVALSTLLLRPVARLLNSQLPKSLSYGIAFLRRDFYRATSLSVLLACAAVIPFILLAGPLVSFFYGPSFAPVVHLVPILMLYAIIIAFSTGIGSMFRTIEKIRVAVLINIVNFCIGMPLMYFVIMRYGVGGMIWSVIIDNLIISLVCHLYFRKYFLAASKSLANSI